MRKVLLVSMVGILLLPAVSFTDDSTESRAGARFTGVFSDAGIDISGDGLFEQLMVSGEIEIDSCAEAFVTGILCAQDGHFVSLRPNRHWTAPGGRAELVSDSGKTVFHILFSGQDIRASKTDGPYKAILWLGCEDSVLWIGRDDSPADSVTYETFAYSYTAFREHDVWQEEGVMFGMGPWELLGAVVVIGLSTLLFWRIYRRRNSSRSKPRP